MAEETTLAAETPASIPPGGMPWWGEFALATGQSGGWRVGPMELWARRRHQSWEIAWRRSGDRRSTDLELRCPAGPGDFPGNDGPEDGLESFEQRTVLVGHSETEKLTLRPACADRQVVAQTDRSRVLPGGSVTLYVSMPLWLHLATGDGHTLLEEPTVRLSDTWFGPSTRAGEICYALRTRAFSGLEEVPRLAFRAVTRLRIENTSHDELQLVRLCLPAPDLALYLDQDRPEAGLFTSQVVLRRSSDGETATMDVRRGPPPELERPERVSSPRQRQSRNVLVRAMTSILR